MTQINRTKLASILKYSAAADSRQFRFTLHAVQTFGFVHDDLSFYRLRGLSPVV